MIKTFKIGEYCKGGIIQVKISKTRLHIINLDYFTKEIIEKRTYKTNNKPNLSSYTNTLKNHYSNTYLESVYRFISSLTTPYYTDTIIKYIKGVVLND